MCKLQEYRLRKTSGHALRLQYNFFNACAWYSIVVTFSGVSVECRIPSSENYSLMDLLGVQIPMLLKAFEH